MLVYKYRGGAFERDLESLKNNEFWASNNIITLFFREN